MPDDVAPKRPTDEMLRHHYEQVCVSYRAIDDFRGKLLALWPILGGAAGGVALLASDNTNDRQIWAVGLVGAVVSTGLAMYEWYQTLRCDRLKQVAPELETRMHFEAGSGQFLSLPQGFKPGLVAPPISVPRHEVGAVAKPAEAGSQATPAEADREARMGGRDRNDVEPNQRGVLRQILSQPIRVGVASALVYGSVILGWLGLFLWGLFQ
jgi:hypothetical protein